MPASPYSSQFSGRLGLICERLDIKGFASAASFLCRSRRYISILDSGGDSPMLKGSLNPPVGLSTIARMATMACSCFSSGLLVTILMA